MRCWLALAVLASASSARAQGTRALDVSIAAPACTIQPLSTDSLFQSIGLELAPQGVAVVPTRTAGSLAKLRITVADCDGATAQLRLEAADGQRTETRELDLRAVDAAARIPVVALATGESVRQTHVFDPHSVPPTERPPPSAPVLDRPWISLEGHARIFGASRLVLGGPEAALGVPLTSWLEVGTRAGLGFGGESDPLGKVHVSLASLSGEARLVAHPVPAIRLALGPDVEVGVAFATGENATSNVTGKSGQATVAVLGLTGTLRAELLSKTWLTMGLGGGGVLAGFQGFGDGRPIAALQGLTFGARIGMARAF